MYCILFNTMQFWAGADMEAMREKGTNEYIPENLVPENNFR